MLMMKEVNSEVVEGIQCFAEECSGSELSKLLKVVQLHSPADIEDVSKMIGRSCMFSRHFVSSFV